MESRIMRPRIINSISHVAGWVIFFSLIIGFLSNNHQDSQSIFSKLFAPAFIIFYFTFLFIFYLNYFVLIPFLYLKKKYTIYFSIVIILFAAVYFIKPFDRLVSMNPPPSGQPRTERMDRPPPPPPNGFERPDDRRPPPQFVNNHNERKDINSIILFIMVWSLSTAICIILQWRLTEQRALQAETGKANAELSFLKSQVNPHFLFNTLNNIYSLAVTKNENTATSIMKLSNIMRYLTDEAGENYVSLDSEIECICDYIDLQKMRLGNTQVKFSVMGNTADKKIPPLILMTFIENVFKYGISNHEASDIIINLSADEHTINFFCQNKLFETKRNTERIGIGISNAKQRLQHLYPNMHFLDINKDNGLFTVHLTLQA